jgi:CheY-like chemotaxis protein/uncharacterized C2H2 Zn-finger protein
MVKLKRLQPESDAEPAPIVLIASSDSDTRSLYRESLISTRSDVVEAIDGRDALVQCFKRPPALLITETRLPYIDGYALCEVLRKDPLTSAVPIVVVTADVDPVALARLSRMGRITVLGKPVAIERLAETVRALGTTDAPDDEPIASSDVSLAPRSRYMSTAVRRFRRFETVAPAALPPALRCPECDVLLKFSKSQIGGVTSRDPEQWDYLACPQCSERFEYRHRTRALRSTDEG